MNDTQHIELVASSLGVKFTDDYTFEGCISSGDCPISSYGRGILYLHTTISYGDRIVLSISSVDDDMEFFRGKPKSLENVYNDFNNLYKDLKGLKVFGWETFIEKLAKYDIEMD